MLIKHRVTQEGPSSLPILEEGVFSRYRIHPPMAFFLRFLIGIVSFGETYCGGLNNPRPGVYTNITSHVQWVRLARPPYSPYHPPRSVTSGSKWRQELAKAGAPGRSGAPAASHVGWASRAGDQVGEVGRCKVGELMGGKRFWIKG